MLALNPTGYRRFSPRQARWVLATIGAAAAASSLRWTTIRALGKSSQPPQ